ncbi:hypothetical protein [Frankia sp. Cr2]|uniref:hypothetical protein n=1 Tax=Frankia sp. Cr2 TaxID=3073932 RepID=UPI002AD502E6|nr:hypothetical protein [Frankia sp. Cr2]
MPLLPAVVPLIPEVRAEIVPARLARKVAPLFGVPWEDGPFGDAAWVSNFVDITLTEIARGAPLPVRSRVAGLTAGRKEWALVDRIGLPPVAGSLPNEIANATLNRFGPDTKAAVVLTAVNRLLDPLRDALDETIPLLVDETGAPLTPGLRLAGWAGVLVEVFRSQPALLLAGILARSIQRPLTTALEIPLAPTVARERLTRCEISAPRTASAPTQPRDLLIADATFRHLGVLGPVAATPVAYAAMHETILGLLLQRLLDVGTMRDASQLWISERRPGQFVLEALLTPTSIVNRFVRDALDYARVEDQALDNGGALPAVPDVRHFAGLGLLTRRVAVIALLGTIRQVLSSPAARERSRDAVLERLGPVRNLIERTLPVDDPVRAVSVCRIDVTWVELTRHDTAIDLRTAVERLDSSTRRCEQLCDAGVLDRGAGAEILAASNIEINAVRVANAERSGSMLPAPDVLDQQLRRRWRHWLEILEVPAKVLAGEWHSSGLLGYHLHNYAAFLASHDASRDGGEADLAEAARLFADVVLPARERFVEAVGIFEPMRVSLQMATGATTGLAEAALARDDLRTAREQAARGHRWITRALTDEATRVMVAEATERSCRFALRAAPALVIAAETGVPGATRDLDQAAELIAIARRWAESALTHPERYGRHEKIEIWSARIDKVRATTG